MRIEAIRLEGRELILTLREVTAAVKRLVYKFKSGDYDLTKHIEKRSNEANKYMWQLCTKIGDAIGQTKEEVYLHAVQEKGRYIQCHVDQSDLKRFTKQWEEGGLGYQVQLVGETPAFVIVNAYYGSHLYDRKEMSLLIDYLIEDARSLDIETMPEEELQSLLTSWG